MLEQTRNFADAKGPRNAFCHSLKSLYHLFLYLAPPAVSVGAPNAGTADFNNRNDFETHSRSLVY